MVCGPDDFEPVFGVPTYSPGKPMFAPEALRGIHPGQMSGWRVVGENPDGSLTIEGDVGAGKERVIVRGKVFISG